MITKKKLYWYKNGTYSAHLHTTRDTTSYSYIGVYKDEKLFCPMEPVSSASANMLGIYYGGIYQAVDITPIMYVYYVGYRHSTDPYDPAPERYDTIQIATTDLNRICHGSINNIVELQNASGSEWTTVLQLPAKADVANLSPAGMVSYTFRLKIGSWTSTSFSLNSSAGYVSRVIPEAQWGV